VRRGFDVSALLQASLQRSETSKPLAIAKGFVCSVGKAGQMSNLFTSDLIEIQQLKHIINSQ